MYIIDPIKITAAQIIDSGSIAEPFTGGKDGPEVEWSAGVWAVGQECVRASLHRVYKCAVARVATDVTPPESDTGKWLEMRPTARHAPFGPYVSSGGQLVFKRLAVQSTTADLVWRLRLRYADTVGIFGLSGARLRCQIFKTVGGPQYGDDIVEHLLRPSTGQFDRRFGLRTYRDRVLINGLPRFVDGELRITVEGGAGQLRRIGHVEVGKLRKIAGVEWGGTKFGTTATLEAQMYSAVDDDGTETAIMYGTKQNLQGSVAIKSERERAALPLLRRLSGMGVACIPSLLPNFQERLSYGRFVVVPFEADNAKVHSVDFALQGLPVDPLSS